MGKIADYLPPMHGTGWAREDVWEDTADGGGCGDYAVGKVYSTRYTYTLPCGTRRLCLDEDYFVEPFPEENPDAEEFTVWQRYEVREEKLERENRWEDWVEVNLVDSGFDHGSALAQYSLSQAEETARRLALHDYRSMMGKPSVTFYARKG